MGRLRTKFRNKEYRDAFVGSGIRHTLAHQIRKLREENRWTQAQLAEKIGTGQSFISRLENSGYAGFSLRTLLRLASAFDVALDLRFVPFSAWTEPRFSEDDLKVSNYQEEASTPSRSGG